MSQLKKILTRLQSKLDEIEALEKKGMSFATEKRLIKNAINKLTGRGDVKLSRQR